MAENKRVDVNTAVVIGASGAIGQNLVMKLSQTDDIQEIYAFSRKQVDFDSPKVHCHFIDLEDESSIAQAAGMINEQRVISRLFIATGLLHEGELLPEKSLEELSPERFQRLFAVNTVGPALIAKHFIPLLPRSSSAVIAILSARVGSIGDNRLGGWYGYRASKAALNMVIKTLSIELKRRCSNAVIVGVHPGTVDSELSRPFQRNIDPDKLFSASTAADNLLALVETLTPEASGKFFAWDGRPIGY